MPQEVGHGPPDKTEHFLNATSLSGKRGEEGGTVTNASSHTPKDAGSKWVIVSMMR